VLTDKTTPKFVRSEEVIKKVPTRTLRPLKTLVGLLLVLLLPQLGWSQAARTGRGVTRSGKRVVLTGDAAARSLVSVEFEECGQPAAQSPTGLNANPDDLAKLLNGVWIGTRILKTGTAPMANYMMVYDVLAKEALIYEERGDSIKENAFAALFPAPAANAPKVTYFYCGSQSLSAFKDVFVKVSDVPRLGQMDKVMGISAPDVSLSKVWDALRASGEFTKDRTLTQLNTAFYTVSISPFKAADSAYQSLRLDMAGQLRGSPNKSVKYANDSPVAGLESGAFDAVSTSTGNYMVSYRSYAVSCYGNAEVKVEEDAPPLTNFRYTKVVIGPMTAQPAPTPSPGTTESVSPAAHSSSRRRTGRH